MDCGASSLIAMKRAGVEANEIGYVLLSHLHGDHFGGLPFLILDGQFRRRERDLTVAGPPGTRERVHQAMEVLFPGSSSATRRFHTSFVEMTTREPNEIGPITARVFEMKHFSGAPSYAVRAAYGGKTIAYSGDTEWTPMLAEAAADSDVFICEAYFFEKRVPHHLDFLTLAEHRSELTCRRLVLTHMSEDMLGRLHEIDAEAAADGTLLKL